MICVEHGGSWIQKKGRSLRPRERGGEEGWAQASGTNSEELMTILVPLIGFHFVRPATKKKWQKFLRKVFEDRSSVEGVALELLEGYVG